MTETEQHSRQFRVFHPAFVALVTAAVLLRIGLSFTLPRVIKWDEPTYLLLGYNLLAGNGFTYSRYPEVHFPPLHPIVAGIFHLLTGDFEMAGNLECAVFGGLLLFPVFAMGRRIYGLQMAWLVAVLLAIFPALTVNVLYWGSMSEPLYLFLLYGGLALLLTGLEDDQLGMFAAAGALLGLAYLTRPEAVVYFGVFLIFASIWLWNGLKSRISRNWSALGLFVLPFVLLTAPYIWYLHVQTGQWMISGKINITWKVGGEKDGPGIDRLYNGLDSSGEEINWLSRERFQGNAPLTDLTNPNVLMDRVLKNVLRLKEGFFTRTNFWWGLTPLVVVGLFKQPWAKRRVRYEVFLITIILVLMLVFLPFGFMIRFYAPAYPVLLMWTARGALELGGWLQDTVELWRGKSLSNRHLKSVLGWLPAGMTAGFLILTIPLAAHDSISETEFGNKEAGLWLKAHSPADAKVMAEDLAVALYADRRWVPSPNADWTRFMKYARARHANYLVVRDSMLDKIRPELAFILQKGTPELELLFSFEEPHKPGSKRTLVYHIVSPSDE
ncbi:MAG: glycosyltransferase family 39 protein [Nitrospirota bacterium]